MANQEKIRRFIPCSLYCTAKIESWLEEMAADGNNFYKFSKFDYAVFLKEKPQKIRYRLCLKGNNKHEPETQKLMQKHGWNRVDEIKNLIVFSSQDPEPFDADDERELSELRDKAIKYYSKQNILSSILMLLPILTFIIFKGSAISAVTFGIDALLIPISMILFVLARHIIEIIDAETYKKHISDNNTHIRNTSKINLTLYVSKYISVVALLVSFVFLLFTPEANSDILYDSIVENENPPFATVEDFVTENAVKKGNPETDHGALYNKWSNTVSKLNYRWRENSDFLHTDGTTERIQLNVEYHDTLSPFLAKLLIWDYYLEDKSLKINSKTKTINGYDIDYGLTYRNWGYLVVIAQKDNKLIRAEFESVRITEDEPFKTIESITDEEAIDIICNNFQ